MAKRRLLTLVLKSAPVIGIAALLGLGALPLGQAHATQLVYATNATEAQDQAPAEEPAESTQEAVDEILTVEGVAKMGDDGPMLEAAEGLFMVDGVDLDLYQGKRVRITGLTETDEQNRRWLVVEKFEVLKN